MYAENRNPAVGPQFTGPNAIIFTIDYIIHDLCPCNIAFNKKIRIIFNTVLYFYDVYTRVIHESIQYFNPTRDPLHYSTYLYTLDVL